MFYNANLILVEGFKLAATQPSYFFLNGKYSERTFVFKKMIAR